MKAPFVILFCFLVTIQGTYSYVNYKDEASWPGKCNSGTMQSPINIVTKEALVDRHGAHIRGPLNFRGYENVQVQGRNNGHTLKWTVADESQGGVLSGGPLRANYTLRQMHLHWLSEHAIDGFKYPLEIHMVHIKTGLSVDEALAQPDGIAVVGIMGNIRVEKEAKHALEELMEDVTQLFDQNTESKDTVTLDFTRLFSPSMQSYYTYHGSLTTPRCEEVVTWIVMDQPIDISDVQYKVISRVDIGGINNYRSLQPTNRVVYKSAYTSCAATLNPSITTFVVALASCLTKNFSGVVTKGYCLLYSLKKRFFSTNDTKICAAN